MFFMRWGYVLYLVYIYLLDDDDDDIVTRRRRPLLFVDYNNVCVLRCQIKHVIKARDIIWAHCFCILCCVKMQNPSEFAFFAGGGISNLGMTIKKIEIITEISFNILKNILVNILITIYRIKCLKLCHTYFQYLW